MSESNPSYDLAEVQALVRAGAWKATLVALNGAGELGLDRFDIEACVLALTGSDFYKTMPAERAPGLFQDVYRPWYLGHTLYVKVQMTCHGANRNTVVISFKRK